MFDFVWSIKIVCIPLGIWNNFKHLAWNYIIYVFKAAAPSGTGSFSNVLSIKHYDALSLFCQSYTLKQEKPRDNV